MPRSVRRVNIGHMGCFGALVGLRQCLATLRAYPESTAALLCVELSSLHLRPTEDPETMVQMALFGDAAGALVIGNDAAATGPEVVDTFCVADFASAAQMSWTITDEGFVMGLSPRVPVTLRRNIGGAVEGLLAPHGLRPSDITHWVVHPGGPSILTVIQRQLELSDEQMALSWQTLRDHGNCSSATVLLILDALLRSGAPRRGEGGVMMAFGPGLTLETCLLRF
jgi:predicted naringenin-chalcone synthase